MDEDLIVEKAKILLSGRVCSNCVYYVRNSLFLDPYCELRSGKARFDIPEENTCEEWDEHYDINKKRKYLFRR